MTEPSYLTEARRHIGRREVAGAKSNVWITALWKAEAWLGNDDSKVPWCGLFMRECMRVAGLPSPKAAYRAKSWLDWGKPLLTPVVGCVVVFDREGGGHVGIVVGRDSAGNIMVLGGNQGDSVKISAFSTARNPKYRWPINAPLIDGAPLPLLGSTGQLSTNEA